MSVPSPGLASLVADQLSQRREWQLEPPAGLPERVLVWLALTPLWTARMAAACGFPAEAERDDRATRRRLQRQADALDSADREPVSAAQHALGVLALSDGRTDQAGELFQQALDGHRQRGDYAGAVAAEFHLAEIAAARGRLDEARVLLNKADSNAAEWADDVCSAVIAGEFARVTSPTATMAALALPSELGPAVLEAARVLERIARSELCASAVADAPETETSTGERLTERRYWMVDIVRQQVIEQAMRDPARGIRGMQDELRLIGSRVLAAEGSGVPILDTVRQWAQLATRAGNVSDVADLLTRECDRLLTFAAETEANPSGTALAWIQAAEPLEELLKGELTAALGRARRQLDLFHRRRDDDQRYLRNFVERGEQTRAVEDLLSSDKAWALHFVGSGGNGKTMLMRYISSVLGPRVGASTARIDFDYLSPEYPVQKPGLLLVELAEELKLSAGDAAISLFAHFDEQVLKLQEQRTGVAQGAAAARDTQLSIQEVLKTFAMALKALPPPVILLIDTCEELAKVRPDGTSPEGVVRTFAVLQELQASVPRLKVIFAGRRPLASSGAGWKFRGGDELPARPYLRLHEIRGFDEAEALRYLESKEVPPHLRPAILTQASGRTDTDRFTWDDPSAAPARIPRFSPFELSGWAALAQQQRNGARLTPEDIISADSDRYVELRIIRRIGYEPLKLALPALGLLGRCDPALLRAAFPELPDFDRMFRELRQQEWISRRGIDFYEMDEALSRRLLTHFERVQPNEVEQCYHRVADYLEQRTLDDPLASLLPFHFDTAMRVLRREPRRAAQWWARAEERFAREEQYEWARQLAEFMLGPEGTCAELDMFGTRSPAVAALRAAVLATQMSCFTHVRPKADRRAGWLEAETLLTGYPDPELGERLRFRALAGQVAAGTGGTTPPPVGAWTTLAQLSESVTAADTQLTASLIAAIEALVEWVEQEAALNSWQATPAVIGRATILHAALNNLAASLSTLPHIYAAAFTYSLLGRIAVLERQFGEAEGCFERSIVLGRNFDEEGMQRWLDWRPPADPWARCRLEFVRGMYPAVLGAQEVLDVITPGPAEGQDGTGSPATVDAERLASAELILRAAVTSVKPDPELLRKTIQPRMLRPERNVHRAFPALATAYAEALAGAGEVDQALELLTTAGRGWERSSVDLESATHAERAALRIIRRMRLRDEGRGLSTTLADSSDLADVELRWSLDALDGSKAVRPGMTEIEFHVPDGADPRVWRHARWRTLSTFAWPAEVINNFATRLLHTEGDLARSFATFSGCSALLDVLEARELAMSAELSPALDDAARHNAAEQLEFLAEHWWQDHPDQPEEALRLLLRIAALTPRDPRRADIPKSLLQRLGRRRAAEIALDEGEMLGLRLPGRSRPIVDLAEAWFSECGDYVGAVIAQMLSALLLGRLGLRGTMGSLFTSKTKQDLGLLPFLPSWDDLGDIEGARTDAGLESLYPLGWRPWLVRLVLCRVWVSYSAKRMVTLRRIQDWINKRYGEVQLAVPGTSQAATVAVPADLDGFLRALTVSTSGTAFSYSWSADHLSGFRRRWRQVRGLRQRLKVLAALVFVPSTTFVLMALTFGLIALFISRGHGAISSFFWLLSGEAGAFILLFIFFAIQAGTRRYHQGAALSPNVTSIPATLTVQAGSAQDGTVGLTLEARGKPTRSQRMSLPAIEDPYVRLSSALPDSIGAGIEKFVAGTRDRRRLLEIRLDQGLGGPCWEAVLGGGTESEEAETWGLRIVRTVASRRSRPVKRWLEIRSSVSLVADLRQDEMATQGWRRLISRRAYSHQVRRPDEVYNEANSGDEVDILHVVATPIDTASGPRLDLGRTTGDYLSSKQSGPPRGELMQPADVTRLFPDTVLCVLQATPQEQSHRTEAERRQAASLRLMAEEIFSLGVPAVVTIPPLPASAGAFVLDALAAAISRRPRRRMVTALTQAVRQARQETGALPGVAAEALFDICLYATEVPAGTAGTPKGSVR